MCWKGSSNWFPPALLWCMKRGLSMPMMDGRRQKSCRQIPRRKVRQLHLSPSTHPKLLLPLLLLYRYIPLSTYLISKETKVLRAAGEAAKGCDAVVIVLGESDEMVGESKSRTSLELPGHQNALVKQIISSVSTKTPVVVVLLNGRPLSINLVQDKVDGPPSHCQHSTVTPKSRFVLFHVLSYCIVFYPYP